jgi:hypothetical protein
MKSLGEQFEAEGYVIIKGLLSPEESAHYRAEIQKLSGVTDAEYGKKTFECADGITQNEPFWPMVYHPRLVEAVRSLLGDEIRYTQHSDLHAHRASKPAAPGPASIGGWHRDSACRDFNIGPDWDESLGPYRIVRVAIYLQTFAESHSSLGVMPGSHRYEERLTGNDRRLWSRMLEAEYRLKRALSKLGVVEEPPYYHPWFQQRNRPASVPLLTRPSTPVWIKTEPGDCIIFNQRLYHSASPITGPKYAMYLSYSPEDEHARNHLRYYRYLRKDLCYGAVPSALAGLLKEHQLYMEVPEPSEVKGATTPVFA